MKKKKIPYKKQSVLLIIILLVATLQSCFFSKRNADSEKNDRPNIIFIMSDDHAVNAISSYGKSVNNTPNIDRLATEGIRFSRSFCTNAICAPARAVILTGKYSHINGHMNNSQSFDGRQQTFPKLLQQQNYQTAIIGKWHLKSDPTGFDFWNILPGQGNYYNPDFIEMGKRKNHKGYVTDLITSFSIDWLEKRDTTRAFCLMMHHKAPHRSWMPALNHINDFDNTEIPLPSNFFDNYNNRSSAASTQKMSIWKDMYLGFDLKLTTALNSTEIISDLRNRSFTRMNIEQRNAWDSAYHIKNNDFYNRMPKGKDLAKWKFRRYLEDYLSTLQSVDESVGEILDYLDEKGLADNTIVVYTSDQGFFLGEHGWFDKRFMYEESLNIPLIIRYPKEIDRGRVSEAMVLNLDIAPTFLDYAGINIPNNIQGKSLREIMKGKKPSNWRDKIYYHYYEYPRGGHDVKRHYGIRTPDFKLIHYYFDIDEWELFDLKKDPHEMKNQYNNPEYHLEIEHLKNELKTLREKYKDNSQNSLIQFVQKKSIKHKGTGGRVSYKYPYSKKYPASGQKALIDGEASIKDLSQVENKSVWQGFEENDMIATIDLKKRTIVNHISAGFLQNTNAWIFTPDWVEYEVSNDNQTFTRLDKILRNTPIDSPKEERISYDLALNGIKVRYIRINAKNISICPKWHKGAGGKAWLFVDEIVIN